MPRIRQTYGGIRDVGNKILVGSVEIPPQKGGSYHAKVNFGGYFNPDCKPVIVVSRRGLSDWRMYQLRVYGLDGTMNVDGTGFAVHVYNAKESGKLQIGAVDWAAFGY